MSSRYLMVESKMRGQPLVESLITFFSILETSTILGALLAHCLCLNQYMSTIHLYAPIEPEVSSKEFGRVPPYKLRLKILKISCSYLPTVYLTNSDSLKKNMILQESRTLQKLYTKVVFFELVDFSSTWGELGSLQCAKENNIEECSQYLFIKSRIIFC